MESRTLATVLLALTTLIAGCPASETTASPDTVTPVALSTEGAPLAPGVSSPGGPDRTNVDPVRLLAADRAARTDTPVRFVRVVRIAGPNGSMRLERSRTTAVNGTFRDHLVATGDGALEAVITNSTVWRGPDRLAVRTTLSSGRIITTDPPGLPRRHRLGRNLTRRILRGGSFAVSARTAGGAHLRSTGEVALQRAQLPVVTGPPRNVSATLVVAESGLIRAIRVRYDASWGKERVDVTIRHRVRRLPNATVQRPDWLNATA